MRYAILKADSRRQVEAYLPANYRVVSQTETPTGLSFIIEGEDNAGWTLDDYVIPRLASGLLFAKEITPEPGRFSILSFDDTENKTPYCVVDHEQVGHDGEDLIIGRYATFTDAKIAFDAVVRVQPVVDDEEIERDILPADFYK